MGNFFVIRICFLTSEKPQQFVTVAPLSKRLPMRSWWIKSARGAQNQLSFTDDAEKTVRQHQKLITRKRLAELRFLMNIDKIGCTFGYYAGKCYFCNKSHWKSAVVCSKQGIGTVTFISKYTEANEKVDIHLVGVCRWRGAHGKRFLHCGLSQASSGHGSGAIF